MVSGFLQERIRDAERTPADRIVVYDRQNGSRRIGLARGRLVEVAAEAEWDDFPYAASLVHTGQLLEAWRIGLFAEQGQLRIEGQSSVAEGQDGILCQCLQVPRSVVATLAARRCSVADICAETGAGTVCGGCKPLIGEIAGYATMASARLVERYELDQHHSRFIFAVEGAVGDAMPGANLLLRAEIAGRHVTRSYTLTGSDSRRGYREITVRREPNGLFSRWLHDHADDTHAFKVSSPIGGLEAHDGSTIFIAAGIGVTPAIAHLKALAAGKGGRFRLHWSGRFTRGSALMGEVVRLVGAVDGAELVYRHTPAQGRMTAADWADFAPVDPTCRIHVCGPVTFMDAVRATLTGLGWAPQRIIMESFVTGPGTSRPRVVRAVDRSVDPVVAESFHLRPCASVLDEAQAYLKQFYYEHGADKAFAVRMAEVEREIAETGTYVHTFDELAYGARMAWRNSTRCIGRFFWQMLVVHDARHIATEDAMFEAILRHMAFATNGGDLRPSITVFRAGPPTMRILNPQLILYAGYRRGDGGTVGDPRNVTFTEFAQSLGWQGRGGAFDILPVILQIGDRRPRIFELPRDAVVEVELEHPSNLRFANLGLKWFSLPAVADMAMDLGGIQYTAAPSNGFYMGTEIGSFNLGDHRRYNMLPAVAEQLDITQYENPLWKDQALVELNRAVLYSFRKNGIRILDHHTLADYFTRFVAAEGQEQRTVYGHWPWIVPPMSANLSDVWHDNTLKNIILKPNYFYQERGQWREKEVARLQSHAKGRFP